VRRITITTILILAAALIPACTANSGPGNGAGAEETPAASQSPDLGGTNSANEPTAADNSGAGKSNGNASEEASNEAATKNQDPCKAAGHPSRRIKFPRGATEATFTWAMNGFDDEQVLLIDVRAGQSLKIEDIGDNPVTLSVCDPDGKNVDDYDLSCHGRFNLDKTKKGDYTVFVTECKKADPWKGDYRLKVTAVDAD
jgi:hypothetical protein